MSRDINRGHCWSANIARTRIWRYNRARWGGGMIELVTGGGGEGSEVGARLSLASSRGGDGQSADHAAIALTRASKIRGIVGNRAVPVAVAGGRSVVGRPQDDTPRLSRGEPESL